MILKYSSDVKVFTFKTVNKYEKSDIPQLNINYHQKVFTKQAIDFCFVQIQNLYNIIMLDITALCLELTKFPANQNFQHLSLYIYRNFTSLVYVMINFYVISVKTLDYYFQYVIGSNNNTVFEIRTIMKNQGTYHFIFEGASTSLSEALIWELRSKRLGSDFSIPLLH